MTNSQSTQNVKFLSYTMASDNDDNQYYWFSVDGVLYALKEDKYSLLCLINERFEVCNNKALFDTLEHNQDYYKAYSVAFDYKAYSVAFELRQLAGKG